MQDKHDTGEGAGVNAIVNTEGGFGAFSDGIFGGGNGDCDVVIVGGRIGSVCGEIFAPNADDAIVRGIVVALTGLK